MAEEIKFTELFSFRSPNKFSNLIDGLYAVGEKVSAGNSDILHQQTPQECVIFLKGKQKTWAVSCQGAWPLNGGFYNDTLVIQLDLTKCKMTEVKRKEKE